MDTFVVTKLVSLSIHDRGDNAVASPQKMDYSTLMDAFVVTNLVFLSIHCCIDNAVVTPSKGGSFEIDGRIRDHEPRLSFHSSPYS